MSTTAYGDISPRTAAFVAVQMLARAEPQFCAVKFGQKATIPRNKTTSIRFRRYTAFAPSTVPLQEGVTPVADILTHTDVEMLLRQYGRYTLVTDVIVDNHEDPVLSELADIMGEVAGQTAEAVIYGRIIAGTNVIFAGGTSRATVNSAITPVALDRAIRQLKRNNAKPHMPPVQGSDKVGTVPVRAAYVAFVHPDLQRDLESVAGYRSYAEYGSMPAMIECELGMYKDIRFMASTLYSPFMAAGASGSTLLTNGGSGTGNADVYPIVITGRDAYSTVNFSGPNSVTPIVLTPKPSIGGNELGQRGSVGFKMQMTAGILNDAWMVRVECGVTQ